MQPLKVLEKQNTLWIEINNPSNQNALNPRVAEELLSIIMGRSSGIQSLVFSHQGPYFCSGGDLSFYAQLSDREQGLQYNKRIAEILKTIHELPLFKVAVVNGTVLGGGVEWLSVFDHIVSTPYSLFALWQRKIGLTLGWQSEKRLVQRLGPSFLRRWLLDTGHLNAYQALDCGLVDQITPYHNLNVTIAQLIESLQSDQASMSVILGAQSQEQAFTELWWQPAHLKSLQRFRTNK